MSDNSEYVDDDGEEPEIPESGAVAPTQEEVQRMILSYLRANHSLWIRCLPILKEEYFNKKYRSVFQNLVKFESKNQMLPSALMVHSDTGIELDVPDDADNSIIEEAVLEKVEEFCRFSAMDNVLTMAYELIREDKSKSATSYVLGQIESVNDISIANDLGFEFHDSAGVLLQQAEKMDGLPTGFPFLDEALNGGVTRPSLNIVSASSGQGKSIFLQNIAVNYSEMGENVAYITLELSEMMVEKRMAAMKTGVGIGDIYQNIPRIVTQLKKDKRRFGDIQIKRFPMTGTTVADIRSYVNDLTSETDEEWNHVIIDYMDLMTPIQPGIREDNIHLRDRAIANELYEWTHDRKGKKIIWSASQQVKGAKEEKETRQSSVSGGVGKVHNCDNLIILKRSNENVKQEQCWGTVEKGRNGGQGKSIPFRWDAKTQKMSNPPELEGLFHEQNAFSTRWEKQTRQDPVARYGNGNGESSKKRSSFLERFDEVNKKFNKENGNG